MQKLRGMGEERGERQAMTRQVYLDHAATTPLDERVLDAMLPYLRERFGNPSSLHRLGREAARALRRAREDVAQVLNCAPREVIFTSGGTESNNLALRGIAFAQRAAGRGAHIIVSAVEHKAVLDTARDLAERYGFDLTIVPVDSQGQVSVEAIAAAVREDTVLVSVMYANNEVGTIQPVADIGALCRERDIPFHTDAVQAAGYCSLDVKSLSVDALSISGHKIYGPKGVGLLYLRTGVPYWPQITGGGQEGGRRSGTEHVAGIVGLAHALTLAQEMRSTEIPRIRALRDLLIQRVLSLIPHVYLTGHPTERLPNHASFVVRGLEIQGVLMGLDLAGVAASSGSACTSAAQTPSHVLTAMGIPHTDAVGHLRLTLGRDTSEEDIIYTVDVLQTVVERLRTHVYQP